MTIKSDFSSVEGHNITYWENDYDVILNFGIRTNIEYKPGLYIPSPEWIISMRQNEAVAGIDFDRIERADEVDIIDLFRNRLARRMKSVVPVSVKKEFQDFILASPYEKETAMIYGMETVAFDIEILRALNRALGRYASPSQQE
jgi:hypothetical protein